MKAVAFPILLASLSASAQPTFINHYAVYTGSYSHGFVLRDVNGDGHLDITTPLISPGEGNAAVWLGDGSGVFNLSATLGPRVASYSVSVGDLNGDTRLDVVAVNHGLATVSVYKGNGDGTFLPGNSYPTGGGNPLSSTIADLDNDGDMDVAVANNSDPGTVIGSIGILLNSGNGTLIPALPIVVGARPYDLLSADLNRDSRIDLIVSNSADNAVAVLLGVGNGTFQQAVSYPVGLNPHGMAIADFNGDQRLDLVVANTNIELNSDSVSVLMGASGGGFQDHVEYATADAPHGVAIEDFDGDGLMDLAVGAGGNVSMLINNGGGKFQAAISVGVGFGRGVPQSGDIDGDGKPDLLLARTNAEISVQLNTTTPFDRIFSAGFESRF